MENAQRRGRHRRLRPVSAPLAPGTVASRLEPWNNRFVLGSSPPAGSLAAKAGPSELCVYLDIDASVQPSRNTRLHAKRFLRSLCPTLSTGHSRYSRTSVE